MGSKNGIFLNEDLGRVVYPWEYTLQLDLDQSATRVIGAGSGEIARVYNNEMAHQGLLTHQESAMSLKGLTVEINSSVLPGPSAYRIQGAELTNGHVFIKLSGCTLSEVDEANLGLTFNHIRYLVKNQNDVKSKLELIIDTFAGTRLNTGPASEFEDESPGSSTALRWLSYVFLVICLIGGGYLLTLKDYPIGIAIVLNGLFVLATALALANINDNLHRIAKGKVK